MSSIRQDDGHRSLSTERSVEEQRHLVRLLNDRVARAAERHHFAGERVPFQCECGAPDCQEIVLLNLDDFHAARSAGGPVLGCERLQNP